MQTHSGYSLLELIIVLLLSAAIFSYTGSNIRLAQDLQYTLFIDRLESIIKSSVTLSRSLNRDISISLQKNSFELVQRIINTDREYLYPLPKLQSVKIFSGAPFNKKIMIKSGGYVSPSRIEIIAHSKKHCSIYLSSSGVLRSTCNEG